MADHKVPKLIQTYIKIRDAIAAKSAELKEWNQETKKSLDAIETALRQVQRDTGQTTLSCPYGTASNASKDYVSVTDWDQFLSFLVDTIICAAEDAHVISVPQPLTSETIGEIVLNSQLHLLNKAIGKQGVKDFMEAEGGVLPPGIKYDKETVIQIRRK